MPKQNLFQEAREEVKFLITEVREEIKQEMGSGDEKKRHERVRRRLEKRIKRWWEE